MIGRVLATGAACALVGVAIVRAAPASWRLEWSHGLLLGAALYLAIARRTGPDRKALLGRAVVFFGLLALQAQAYFEWLPAADLRAPFVLLSVWIVTESLFEERRSVAAGDEVGRPALGA